MEFLPGLREGLGQAAGHQDRRQTIPVTAENLGGTTPQDWPEDLPALRAKEWNHILYGDQRGGGHSSGYGWIHDRTEFDAEWTSENITSKLCEFLRNIDFQNVRISELFTMSKDGVKYAIGVARKRGRVRVTTFYRLED